jgi:hypothetical protein
MAKFAGNAKMQKWLLRTHEALTRSLSLKAQIGRLRQGLLSLRMRLASALGRFVTIK